MTGSSEPVAVIAERVHELMRDIQRLRTQYTSRAEPDSEWAASRLIVTLVREGPMRLMALAAATQSDPSTVSRQVSALVRSGVIERRPDPVDGRASLLVPTEIAQRRYEDHLTRRNEGVATILTDWSDDDREQLAQLLTRFTDDFRRFRLAGPAPGCVSPTAASTAPTAVSNLNGAIEEEDTY